MARIQYKISGNGVVEHNFLASEATRQIEAQTKVSETIDELQNGMVLFIDRKKGEIVFDESHDNFSSPYLMHSTVRYYNVGERGLKHFVFKVNNEEELPRLWKLTEGDKFHTNLISFNSNGADASVEFETEEEVDEAFAEEGSLYGYPDGEGMIQVTKIQDTDREVEFIVTPSTMQNDEKGFFVQVNKAR